MTSIPNSPVHRSPEAFTIPVVILGLLVAGVQGLLSVFGVFALWATDVPIPGEPDPTGSDDYVRVALWSLPNLGLCILALAATFVAVRSRLRGASRLPWACVGLLFVIGAMTLLRLPPWPGGEI